VFRLLNLLLYSKVSTKRLFSLNRLEESLEVASTKALVVASLDHFQEQGRTILDRLGKNLEQVPFIIIVNEDFLSLKHVDVFLNLNVTPADTNSKVVVVSVGDLVKELNSTCLHTHYGSDDVLSTHRDVLHASTAVIVTELLDLRFTHTVCRLIYWHLDLLVKVSHHNRAEGRELGVDHLVIYRPEAMEV